jgi:hypothetical protein
VTSRSTPDFFRRTSLPSHPGPPIIGTPPTRSDLPDPSANGHGKWKMEILGEENHLRCRPIFFSLHPRNEFTQRDRVNLPYPLPSPPYPFFSLLGSLSGPSPIVRLSSSSSLF